MNTFCQIMAQIAATVAEVSHPRHHLIQCQFPTVVVCRPAFSRFPRSAGKRKHLMLKPCVRGETENAFLERAKFSFFVGVSTENL